MTYSRGERIAWWREATKEQWFAYSAAWLGWVLDVFDFAMFTLMLVPIAKEFGMPLTAVAFLLSVTLWLRLVGAVAGGWLADRIGRKLPLMISIAIYSMANFVSGLAPTYSVLLLCRSVFGLGMGAEWPVGAALAMESWPARSRGFMSAMLQASSSIGFLLASIAYGFLFNKIGWRGLMMIGVLPGILVIVMLYFVNESPVWLENRRIQTQQMAAVRAPLLSIFRPDVLKNTLNASWWIISSLILYYSVSSLFPTHLQNDLKLNPAMVATPFALANLLTFLASGAWGLIADRWGRRWAMIIPATIAIVVAPIYLLSHNLTVIIGGFMVQGMFGMAVSSQQPSYLSERFPTEVRATASGFIFHLGSFVAGFVPLILTWLATSYGIGLGISMLIGTVFGASNVVLALLWGPETKGAMLNTKPLLT